MKPFERLVGKRGGGQETLSISSEQVDLITRKLLADQEFVELLKKYSSAKKTRSLSEEEEILLKQTISPKISEELRSIQPTFQVFLPGIFDALLEVLDQ